MDRAETIPDEALYEDPKSAPRGAQDKSKGQSKKIPRAPREDLQGGIREAPRRRPQDGAMRVPRGVSRGLEGGAEIA